LCDDSFGRVTAVILGGNEDDDRKRMRRAAPDPVDCVLAIRRQLPTLKDGASIALAMAGVAIHRPPELEKPNEAQG
jgi:alcohol dehydrogenase